MEKDLTDAQVYLARTAHACKQEGVTARIAAFTGQAAEQILEVAHAQGIDLIVMCSHGHTGFKRWALGSVAQKVVRHSQMPVLLLRGRHVLGQPGRPLRVTVALDGSPLAETALGPAAQLVTALSLPDKGELHLLHLVHLPTLEEEWNLLLNAEFDFRQAALLEASRSLRELRARFLQSFSEQPGFHLTCSVEECNDIAERLIKIVEKGEGIGTSQTSDLLAMTTRGYAGLRRYLLGSITERVLHHSTLPLLIVHPYPAEEAKKV
jgi:nucleotide-binding universal stress UspA family protein